MIASTRSCVIRSFITNRFMSTKPTTEGVYQQSNQESLVPPPKEQHQPSASTVYSIPPTFNHGAKRLPIVLYSKNQHTVLNVNNNNCLDDPEMQVMQIEKAVKKCSLYAQTSLSGLADVSMLEPEINFMDQYPFVVGEMDNGSHM
jgi:hypothetical protein